MNKEELLARICFAGSKLTPVQLRIYLELLLFQDVVGEKILFRTLADWSSEIGYSTATTRRELQKLLKTEFVGGVNLDGGGVVPGYFAKVPPFSVNDFNPPVQEKLPLPVSKGFISLLYLYLVNKKKEEINILIPNTGKSNFFDRPGVELLGKLAEKATSEEKRKKVYLHEFKLNRVMSKLKADFNTRVREGKLKCEPWPETEILPTRTKRAILRAFHEQPMAAYWLNLFTRLESITDPFPIALSFHRVVAEHRKWSAYTIVKKRNKVFDL